MSVCVVERRGVVGGAAVTEEFHPGFRNSTASYTVSLLDPNVIRDLRLAQHGLVVRERPFANFLPLARRRVSQGRRRHRGHAGRGRQVLEARCGARCPRTTRCSTASRTLMRELLHVTPPNLGSGAHSRRRRRSPRSCRQAGHIARCRLPSRRDLLDLFTKSAGEILDRWFESAPIKAAFGFDAVVGNFASPYTPGSAYVLLHHVFGEVNGKRGQWGHAIGGMGAITQAMAAECAARGVDIRSSAPVAPRDREGRPRGGCRARKRRGDRGATRDRQRESQAAVRASWLRPSTCPTISARASTAIAAGRARSA